MSAAAQRSTDSRWSRWSTRLGRVDHLDHLAPTPDLFVLRRCAPENRRARGSCAPRTKHRPSLPFWGKSRFGQCVRPHKYPPKDTKMRTIVVVSMTDIAIDAAILGVENSGRLSRRPAAHDTFVRTIVDIHKTCGATERPDEVTRRPTWSGQHGQDGQAQGGGFDHLGDHLEMHVAARLT